MISTSPGLISRRCTAAKQSSSESNTRAGPVCLRRSWPASLTTAPSGASDPRRMAKPPDGLKAWAAERTTCCPGSSSASFTSSRMLRPLIVRLSFSSPASSKRRATRRTPPARSRSTAMKRPPGFRSAMMGVRAAMASKSSSVERHIRFLRQRHQVQDGVGRAGRGGHRRDGVLERRPGEDLAGPQILGHEAHDDLAGPHRDARLARIDRRHIVEPHRRDAQHLAGHGHRVGGELAAAGPGAGTGDVFQRAQLALGDPPGGAGARPPRRRPGW